MASAYAGGQDRPCRANAALSAVLAPGAVTAYNLGMPPTEVTRTPSTRVGLVGYGSSGRGFHAPLIGRAGLTLAAVSTSDATRAQEVRSEHPEAQVVPDLDSLLAVDALDLVVLASP